MNIYVCCSYVSEKKLTFCNEIATHVAKEKIPADLVINWDQTPLHYIPASKWTMEAEGTSKVPIPIHSNTVRKLSSDAVDLHREDRTIFA